jgi:Kef-type K+ transport system membrane component KefB
MRSKVVAMYRGRLFRHPHETSVTTAVALAQGGEFAFVLLGFVLGARVPDAELARLLTAIVAVSMAATPARPRRLRAAGAEPHRKRWPSPNGCPSRTARPG